MAKFWLYSHIAIWLYGFHGGQHGCLLKKKNKCSNPVKELNWLDLPGKIRAKLLHWHFSLCIAKYGGGGQLLEIFILKDVSGFMIQPKLSY